MAGICRLNTLRALARGVNSLTSQKIACCTIATSPKKNDNTSGSKTPVEREPWVSYGFSSESKLDDRRWLHETFFAAITVGMVFTGFVLMFKPDTMSNASWAQREAYLQLRHREEHGLPLIDPNIVDPAKVVLPTDEELGDTDIII